MITLDIAPLVNSVLGSNATVGYDKFVIASINYDVISMRMSARIQMTSTGDPSMQAVNGSLKIDTATAVLTVDVDQLDFRRQVVLTGPQNASIQSLITGAQNSIENGLVSLGIVAGAQTAGA